MSDTDLLEVAKAAEKGRWERFRSSDFYYKFPRGTNVIDSGRTPH